MFIKAANQLDAVHSSATRISSSAESLGAVEYEARLSAAVQVLILYVDHIKVRPPNAFLFPNGCHGFLYYYYVVVIVVEFLMFFSTYISISVNGKKNTTNWKKPNAF